MTIIEKTTQNIIVKSRLPDADFVLNPYIGCMHKCIYCYAEFMCRFIKVNKKWGDFVFVKKFPYNSRLEKYENKKILISSVTDPYQQIEKKYRTMQKILPMFYKSRAYIEILTKSSLVTRDLRLLKKIPNIKVGISLNTMNDSFREKIEPHASPVTERVKAIEKLKKEGINTYLFLSPIFPNITDLKDIIYATHHLVDNYLIENLNLGNSNKNRVLNFIRKEYPSHIDLYQNLYEKDKAYKNEYWSDYAKNIIKLQNKYKKGMKFYFKH